MKNIYLIPTDKPSRLIIYSTLLNEFRLLNDPIEDWKHKRHIYITSDEEIKVGDWIYGLFNGGVVIRSEFDVPKNSQYYKEYGLKIILTTDRDLINDGVQVIDDEFLEWFVENPSCEEVKTDLVPVNEFDSEITIGGYGFDRFKYKIIIPKEKSKKEQDKDKYSEEDMVKFSSWILLQDITSRGEGNYVNTNGKIVTVKDLFEQFKKK
jgi:hypothetical protein